MKKTYLILCLTLFLSAALPLRAQGGEITTGTCDDSPENPTVLLAAVGTAGAFLKSAHIRLKSRRAANTDNDRQ